jgi:uncharacterized membrane protein YuzA (DUF378 family)
MFSIDQNLVNLIVQILLIAGAVNWGLVAFNNTDVVNLLIGATFGSYVKMLVGVAGIYAIYQLVVSFTQKKE